MSNLESKLDGIGRDHEWEIVDGVLHQSGWRPETKCFNWFEFHKNLDLLISKTLLWSSFHVDGDCRSFCLKYEHTFHKLALKFVHVNLDHTLNPERWSWSDPSTPYELTWITKWDIHFHFSCDLKKEIKYSLHNYLILNHSSTNWISHTIWICFSIILTDFTLFVLCKDFLVFNPIFMLISYQLRLFSCVKIKCIELWLGNSLVFTNLRTWEHFKIRSLYYRNGESDMDTSEMWSQHMEEFGDKLNQDGDRSSFLRMVNRNHFFNSSNYSLSSLFRYVFLFHIPYNFHIVLI